MTDPQGSQAYDLSLFESKKAKVTTIRPNKKQLKANRRHARLQAVLNAVTVMITAGVIVAAFGMIIANRIQLTEMNRTAAELKNELAILKSENQSLTHALAAQTSNENVEAYAKEHRMQKAEHYQIQYFTVESGDLTERTPEAVPWWESAWNSIMNFFGAAA